MTNRAPWFKNTAPTYAGIFLWFIFWDSMSGNGLPRAARANAARHRARRPDLPFPVLPGPGLLGLKTGLPLYVVGTSTFGAWAACSCPASSWALLQFGWLGVNTFGSAKALAKGFNAPWLFYPLCVIWALGAAFVGLKGIQYVAKVATYLPLIPLAVLLLGLVLFGGSAFSYTPPADAASPAAGCTAILR